ncbi:MAG: TIGR01777 family oxidoreductase [Bacteroidota bacterium]
MKKILVTGATGLIGKKIVDKLIKRGDETVVLTRSVLAAQKILPNANRFIEFYYDRNITEELSDVINQSDAIIHLAGENIMAKRWTKEHKKIVIESRVKFTEKLVEKIKKTGKKPKTFISASAVGFYGNRFDDVDESSGKGSGFLPDVTNAWEKSTLPLDELGIRRVNVRIGIVFTNDGGALPKLVTPFKFFIGGSLGTGKQWIPWIHINDLVNIFLYALDNESINGAVNAVSPNPVTMNELSSKIGKVLHRPSFFRVPQFILKIILGESADSILEGAKVIPYKLNSAGFEFQFKYLKDALTDLLG